MILTLLKANVSYTIRIYTGVEDSPTSGKEATIQTGITNFGGYYRVDLNDKVELKAGEKFSVVLELRESEGGILPVEVTDRGTNGAGGATKNPIWVFGSQPGQSYFAGDLKGPWTDMYDFVDEKDRNL